MGMGRGQMCEGLAMDSVRLYDRLSLSTVYTMSPGAARHSSTQAGDNGLDVHTDPQIRGGSDRKWILKRLFRTESRNEQCVWHV